MSKWQDKKAWLDNKAKTETEQCNKMTVVLVATETCDLPIEPPTDPVNELFTCAANKTYVPSKAYKKTHVVKKSDEDDQKYMCIVDDCVAGSLSDPTMWQKIECDPHATCDQSCPGDDQTDSTDLVEEIKT